MENFKIQRIQAFYKRVSSLQRKNSSEVDELNSSCLCEKIKPVLRLTQLIGVNVLSINSDHQEGKNHSVEPATFSIALHSDSDKCRLTTNWTSIPSLINFVLVLCEIYFSSQIYYRLKEHMTIFFKGTDFYAFALQVIFINVQAALTMMFARFKRSSLKDMWNEIVEVSHVLKSVREPQIFAKFKIANFIMVCLILIGSFSYGYYVVYNMLIPCQGAFVNKTIHKCPYSAVFILDKVNHGFLSLLSLTTAGFFTCCCCMIYFLHVKLAEKLKGVMVESKSGQLSKDIEDLRLLHEKLCKGTRALENYFGIPILMIACSAILSITCGLYTFILMEGNLFPNTHDETQWFLRMWCFQMYIGIFILAGILISGQLISCAAVLPMPIFYDISHRHLDSESKYQVTLFINKISGSPSCISAGYITKINMAFFASAVTNVITYLLVILQFRLSIDARSA